MNNSSSNLAALAGHICHHESTQWKYVLIDSHFGIFPFNALKVSSKRHNDVIDIAIPSIIVMI